MKRFAPILLSALLLAGCTAPVAAPTQADTQPQAGTQASTEPTVGATYRQVSMEEAMAMMEQQTGYLILDVRTQEEYDSGHIPGAICISHEQIGLEPLPQLPDKEQLILVYCRSGRRSKLASENLAAQGYRNVVEFGGIIDWPGQIVTP